MKSPHRLLAILLLATLSAAVPVKLHAISNPPRVLVTIKPVHSLLAAVSQGVFEPDLLLDGVSSPHYFQLKPSAVKLIHQTDLLIWVGEGIESFLIRPLRSVSDNKTVMKLMDVPGLKLLPLRTKALHDLQDRRVRRVDDANQLWDNHFWLDPQNASVLVAHFANTLAGIDPANAETYQANAARTQIQLKGLTEDLHTLLADNNKSYLLFHDSFQYFEHEFDLPSAGVVSVMPDAQPAARRIKALQQLINDKSVECLFSEPQFQSRSVQMLVTDSNLKHAVIDPLGSAVSAGPTMYSDWLKGTAGTIHACLSG